MLSALGLKKTIRKEINYLVFIDEIYLYLMKDIQYDKTKPYMRRLGNKYSLYMDFLVPLMHIIALAFPTATSANSYSSPFLVKCFMKGIFTLSMAVIMS